MKFLPALMFLALSTGWGHSRLKLEGTLKPRSSSSGIKLGPCGDGSDTKNPFAARVRLRAGSNLLVEWEETVNHPGYFRIALATCNDTDFDKHVLADRIPHEDMGTPHSYSRTVTLPKTPCAKCTIQLVQYMTENPLNPALYFSCADIEIY